MIKDGGYGDYCPNCKQSLSSMGVIKEIKPPPKKPSTLWNVIYIFAWFAVIGGGIGLILMPNRVPASGLSFVFWVGILTAMTATKQGKSGWLWFFIGFICFGFTTILLISFFQGYFGAYNKPINIKLKEMEYVEKIAEKIGEITVAGNGNVIEQLKDIFSVNK